MSGKFVAAEKSISAVCLYVCVCAVGLNFQVAFFRRFGCQFEELMASGSQPNRSLIANECASPAGWAENGAESFSEPGFFRGTFAVSV